MCLTQAAPLVLRPGAQQPRPEATRGQGHALRACGQRTGKSSCWSSQDSCRCGRGICCVAGPRSWSRKASASATPVWPPRRRPTFLRGARSKGPAATSRRPTLRIRQREGRKLGTRGSLWASSLLSGVRTEPDFPSVQWGRGTLPCLSPELL